MRRGFLIAFTTMLALGWGCYFALGSWFSQKVASKLGAKIVSVSKGKVAEPSAFVNRVGYEGLLLASLAGLFVFTAGLVFHSLHKRRAREAWVWKSVVIFAAVNLWVACAMNTTLFWGGLFTGSATANYTQFQFKKMLLRNAPAPKSLLLMGSSQTQAQLDETQMNEALRRRIWTTELHFPGSCGVDLLLTMRRLAGAPGQTVVVYTSENTFFNGIHTEAPPFFARWQDIPVLKKTGLGSQVWSEPFALGYFGQMLPLFHVREAMSHRVLGPALSLTPQAAHDEALDSDLEERARQIARQFTIGTAAEVQMKAFEEFIREAGSQGREVIVLEGQLNPELGAKLDPEMRRQMREFLAGLAARHSNVQLVKEEQLPPQVVADYKDLTHVTPEAQARFTAWFVKFLIDPRI